MTFPHFYPVILSFCCGGVSKQLGGGLAASWGQPTTLFLSPMIMLGLYQSKGSGNGFSGKHRKLNFIDLKLSHDTPASGTGKAGGAKRNVRALRNPTCWSCSFQTPAGMQTQQLLGLLKECVPSFLQGQPSLHTPCICRGSGSSQPGFPGVGNGRSRKQCLCCADAPGVCSPGEQRGLPRLVASLEFQDVFSRWSNPCNSTAFKVPLS